MVEKENYMGFITHILLVSLSISTCHPNNLSTQNIDSSQREQRYISFPLPEDSKINNGSSEAWFCNTQRLRVKRKFQTSFRNRFKHPWPLSASKLGPANDVVYQNHEVITHNISSYLPEIGCPPLSWVADTDPDGLLWASATKSSKYLVLYKSTIDMN